MGRLYNIEQGMEECWDSETGEVLDAERLEKLDMERTSFIEYLCLMYKNYCADAVAYKAEKDSFGEKQKHAENKAKSLKEYIDLIQQGEPFKTSKVNVTYRESTSTQIDCDVYSLPENYLKYSEPTPLKEEIKKALKSGEKIDGCSLVKTKNISIK